LEGLHERKFTVAPAVLSLISACPIFPHGVETIAFPTFVHEKSLIFDSRLLCLDGSQQKEAVHILAAN
jgi:hypothetical protein